MKNGSPNPRTIAERIEELQSLYERELLRPMPYEDCYKIKGYPDGPYESLIPDLDTYLYQIASPSNAADCLPGKSTSNLLQDRTLLSRTFFEDYPLYADLERLVTRKNTPKLYQELEVYERARTLLLEFIQAVLESRGVATDNGERPVVRAENKSLTRGSRGPSRPSRVMRSRGAIRPSKGRSVQRLVEELGSLGWRKLSRLSPRDECLSIIGDPEGPYAGFSFDMDWYMYTIASFAREAKKMTTDTADSLLASQDRFSQTFFELCPQYTDLERLVTKEKTPKLYELLGWYDRARRLLLELIEVVLERRGEVA